ncbi:MAG: flavodoxin [Helicobacteraceae bacterium]|nr:flavodoxin [Helicobacteraceae bacterium]
MNKIGIFYGTTTGKTQEIVESIALKLQNCELFDVSKAQKEDLAKFDNLILASSTYGDGELQSDWEDFATSLSEDDFIGKIVAIIGLGDQDLYSDTFCNSIGLLANLAKKATIIGQSKNENYEFTSTNALNGDEFMGLALDEDNQSDLSAKRIDSWIESIKDKFK